VKLQCNLETTFGELCRPYIHTLRQTNKHVHMWLISHTSPISLSLLTESACKQCIIIKTDLNNKLSTVLGTLYRLVTAQNEKKRSERRKYCTVAVVRWSRNFSSRRKPLPGGAGWPKFNQLEWRWSLPLPTVPVW